MLTGLGDKIRTKRKEKKLTLEQLAKASASSKSYIWELENSDARKVARPSADKLARIANALDTTVDFLLGIEDGQKGIDHEDKVFFRKYQSMTPDAKKKLQKMIDLDIWDD